MRSLPLPAHQAPCRCVPARPPRAVWLLTALLLLLPRCTPCSAGLETALEKLIGRQAAEAMAEQFGTEQDPVLVDWVRHISDRVAAVSPRRDLRYRVQIIEMDEPNAVALPGGYIFVTKGLLEFVHDDDELAAIIAHEVGHQVGKHGIRHIEHQILASLLIAKIQDRAGDLAGTGATLMDAILSLQRSRNDELASDRMGVEYAARAGYDPAGILGFFEKIRQPRKPSWLDTLFSTHPEPETRIARISTSPYLRATPRGMLIAIGDRLAEEGRYNKALAKYRAAEEQHAVDAGLTEKISVVLAAQGKGEESVALRARAGLAPLEVPALVASPLMPALGDTLQARQAVVAVHRDLSERQRQLLEKGGRVYTRLRQTSERHDWTQRLEATLASLPQGFDYRWAYVAIRCVVLSAEIDALMRGAWRGIRHSHASMGRAASVCALAGSDTDTARFLTRDLLSGIALDMERAGKESTEAMAVLDRAIPELAEADRVVRAVLVDLNSPYVMPWASTWGHLAALEGFLQHAGYCTRRARERIATGVHLAVRARARAERAALDTEAASATPQEAVVFRTLVRSRLKVTDTAVRDLMRRGYSLGDATVMLLFTRSTGQTLPSLEASHQEAASWIETAEKLGLSPETQAIVLRLLNNTIAEERVRG